jgi:hypothetical protein
MREYRAARRHCCLAEFSASIRVASTAAQVTGLTAAAIRDAGGPNRFAAALRSHFDACPPGSRRAGNVLLAILRLLETCQAPPIDQITDGELALALDKG